MASPGDIFDQLPGKMSYIKGKLVDYIRDHVVLSSLGAVFLTCPGAKSSYPSPQPLNILCIPHTNINTRCFSQYTNNILYPGSYVEVSKHKNVEFLVK